MFNFLVIYVSTELIYKDFEEFGKIGDFYRPTNLQRGMPSRYAFVRYYNKDDADRASLEMHGRKYGDSIITVDDANLQNSFFTQDTGKIIKDYIATYYYSSSLLTIAVPFLCIVFRIYYQ